MSDKVLGPLLGPYEYVMLALVTLGVLYLVLKAAGVKVDVGRESADEKKAEEKKEGYAGERDSNPGLRFTLRDDTGARNSKYDGMLGSAEPPVFWTVQTDMDQVGAVREESDLEGMKRAYEGLAAARADRPMSAQLPGALMGL